MDLVSTAIRGYRRLRYRGNYRPPRTRWRLPALYRLLAALEMTRLRKAMSEYANAATSPVQLIDLTFLSVLAFRAAGDLPRLANTVAFVEASYREADRTVALRRTQRRAEKLCGAHPAWTAARDELLRANGWHAWTRGFGTLPAPARLENLPAPGLIPVPPRRILAPAVIAHLNGGLGNQVFQYAGALRYAHGAGGNLRVHAPVYRRKGHLRSFLLPQLGFDTRGARLFQRVRARRHPIRGWNAFTDSDSIEPAGSAWIGGTWENPGFFAGIEDEVEALLTPRDASVLPRARAAVDSARTGQGEVVAMHMRRGDRKAGTAAGARFPSIPAAYFIEAARTFPAGTSFLVFSDSPGDIEACRAELAALDVTLHFADGTDPIEDLFAIAACDHMILSAGTFSWWAGWLNRKTAKRVIVPDPLRGGGPLAASGGGGAPALAHWEVVGVGPFQPVFRRRAHGARALPSKDG